MAPSGLFSEYALVKKQILHNILSFVITLLGQTFEWINLCKLCKSWPDLQK